VNPQPLDEVLRADLMALGEDARHPAPIPLRSKESGTPPVWTEVYAARMARAWAGAGATVGAFALNFLAIGPAAFYGSRAASTRSDALFAAAAAAILVMVALAYRVGHTLARRRFTRTLWAAPIPREAARRRLGRADGLALALGLGGASMLGTMVATIAFAIDTHVGGPAVSAAGLAPWAVIAVSTSFGIAFWHHIFAGWLGWRRARTPGDPMFGNLAKPWLPAAGALIIVVAIALAFQRIDRLRLVTLPEATFLPAFHFMFGMAGVSLVVSWFLVRRTRREQAALDLT
jgi:hypothetical protein